MRLYRQGNSENRRKMGNRQGRVLRVTAAALLFLLCAGGQKTYAREPETAVRESASVATQALSLDREQLSFSVTCGSRKVQGKRVTVTNESKEDLVVYVWSETGHFLAGGEVFVSSGTSGILEAKLAAGAAAELVITPKEGLSPEESPCEERFLLTSDTGLRRTLFVTAEVAYDEEKPELLADGEPLQEKTYAGSVPLTAADGSLLAERPEGPFAKEVSVPQGRDSITLYAQKKDGSVTQPQTVSIPREKNEDLGKETVTENRWTEPLTMESWTMAEAPKEPSAKALTGTVQYEYYDSSKNALNKKPEAPGLYFVRAMVPSESSTGTSLVSSYVAFQIRDVHAFGVPYFVWNEGHSACSVVFSCLYEEGHREILPAQISVARRAATCEEAGAVVYTAEVTFRGTTYQDTCEAEIPALGHRYTKAHFSWSEDGSCCEVDFVCENDSTHAVSASCRVTENIVQEPACTQDGEKVLTASAVRPDGTPCSECRIVSIPAAHTLVRKDGHYRCEVCGKKFADAEGTQEIRSAGTESPSPLCREAVF